MQNGNDKRDKKRLKEKEKDRRKYKGQNIYAELQITKDSDIFPYLLIRI